MKLATDWTFTYLLGKIHEYYVMIVSIHHICLPQLLIWGILLAFAAWKLELHVCCQSAILSSALNSFVFIYFDLSIIVVTIIVVIHVSLLHQGSSAIIAYSHRHMMLILWQLDLDWLSFCKVVWKGLRVSLVCLSQILDPLKSYPYIWLLLFTSILHIIFATLFIQEI